MTFEGWLRRCETLPNGSAPVAGALAGARNCPTLRGDIGEDVVHRKEARVYRRTRAQVATTGLQTFVERSPDCAALSMAVAGSLIR